MNFARTYTKELRSPLSALAAVVLCCSVHVELEGTVAFKSSTSEDAPCDGNEAVTLLPSADEDSAVDVATCRAILGNTMLP